MFRVQPQVQREEGKPDALVLPHVSQLVSPERVVRFAREDHHASERDRGIASTGEHEMRQTSVAHVEKAAVAEPRACERQPAESVSDRIGVMSD
jgi:hypothetical protein